MHKNYLTLTIQPNQKIIRIFFFLLNLFNEYFATKRILIFSKIEDFFLHGCKKIHFQVQNSIVNTTQKKFFQKHYTFNKYVSDKFQILTIFF